MLVDGTQGIQVTDLGTIGIFIILLLREIPNLISIGKGKNGTKFETLVIEQLTLIKNQVKDLHQWHDKEDTNGVKIWYVPKSLEESIAKLTDTILAQTDLLKNYPIIMESIVERLKEISEEIKQIKKL